MKGIGRIIYKNNCTDFTHLFLISTNDLDKKFYFFSGNIFCHTFPYLFTFYLPKILSEFNIYIQHSPHE